MEYIVIEGPEGAGKSTIVRRLQTDLGDRFQFVREPGSTPYGEALRNLVLYTPPESELALMFGMFSARAELTSKIKTYMRAGFHVVSDRGMMSTFAYQATTPDLEAAFYAMCKLIKIPAHYILLDCDYETYIKRRPKGAEKLDAIEDSVTSSKDAYQKLRYRYLNSAKLFNASLINGREQQEIVYQKVLTLIKGLTQ